MARIRAAWAGAAGHGPAERVPDGIRPGERHRRGDRARCGGRTWCDGLAPDPVRSAGRVRRPAGGSVQRTSAPAALGQPPGQFRGQPLARPRPSCPRAASAGPGRRGHRGPAQRVAARAARAGLADPGGQPAQRLRGDGERQVPPPGAPRRGRSRRPRRRRRSRAAQHRGDVAGITRRPAGQQERNRGRVAARAAARRGRHRPPAAGQRRALAGCTSPGGRGQLTGGPGRGGSRARPRVAALSSAGDHSEKGIRAGPGWPLRLAPAVPRRCRRAAWSRAGSRAASSRTTRIISPGSNGLVR